MKMLCHVVGRAWLVGFPEARKHGPRGSVCRGGAAGAAGAVFLRRGRVTTGPAVPFLSLQMSVGELN